MSLEDFTHEKWIENIKERQAIEFKKHKGTSFGIYLELLGETITQNYEAFQSQKAITELAVKGLKEISQFKHYPDDHYNHSFQKIQRKSVTTLFEIERLTSVSHIKGGGTDG